jgi:hypothetical protein
MGVDPPHRLAAGAVGAAEEVQHRLLRRIGLGHLAPGSHVAVSIGVLKRAGLIQINTRIRRMRP